MAPVAHFDLRVLPFTEANLVAALTEAATDRTERRVADGRLRSIQVPPVDDGGRVGGYVLP
jgi:hypothetical protein